MEAPAFTCKKSFVNIIAFLHVKAGDSIIKKTGKILGYCQKKKRESAAFSESKQMPTLKTGLPWSGKKFWKMKIFPGGGKVSEIGKKTTEVRENSGNFKIF